MNPIQMLMMRAKMSQMGAPKVATVPPAPTYTPDVAQNIGQDKLAKHAYNPYGLLTLNPTDKDPDADPNTPAGKFTKELLQDPRE